jgi:hypothetical protein
VSPAATQLHPDAETSFKDSYLVDFLGLPEAHSEQQLQTAIIVNLKRFLLELGRDCETLRTADILPMTLTRRRKTEIALLGIQRPRACQNCCERDCSG